MELRRYLSIVRRRLLLVIAIVAAALAAGYLITPRDDTYTATTTLYVGSRSIDIDPRAVSGDRVAGFDRLIATFTAMIRSEPVARAAARAADVDRSASDVRARTQAEQVQNTNLIAVSVTDRDPATARALANEVADAFVAQIEKFEPRNGDEQVDVASVYERALLPTSPNPSPLLRNLILAALLGLVIAGGAVALLEHLDISLRSTDDVERRLELPVLGVVPALGDELPVTPAASVRAISKPRTPSAARTRGAPGA
jgi:capsular polysaccharide biosynthesis protein